MTDRDRHILDLLQQVRADMNSRLDSLVAAVHDTDRQADPPHRRRAPVRPPYRGSDVPSDLERATARAVLKRMRILP